jgi:hypothetical protein
MASSAREVEHRSASACQVLDNLEDSGAAVPEVYLAEGTSIRVAPMERSLGGWDDEHFHPLLKLPPGSNVSNGMVVTLEGTSIILAYNIIRLSFHNIYVHLILDNYSLQ